MNECLFCRMADGQMDVAKLHDDSLVFAIRDINPRAPVHIMVIPKAHIPTARDLSEADGQLLARMFTVANLMADKEGIGERGYRLAINCGDDAGMSISHLHLHLLGGRRLGAEG
ncbi:MAG TPA: histidine triad nucleotide-binding protein [Dehalococcoidia bacterium]|nr:histidine triad nucleotide-binding protein [Dehalococcoidia bacterium]